MSIITVSRQLAALGDETAHELAKRLGYDLIDRQTLEEKIRSYGVLPSIIEKYDERKPGFISGLSQEHGDYIHFLKLALFQGAAEKAGKGCIFIGRGAYAVLGNIPGVVSVLLVSNKEIRTERVRSYFHCDEKKARSIIEQSDRERVGFHKYFFESDWNDISNYRLSLNTGGLHPSAAAGIIEQAVKQTVTAEMEAALAEKTACCYISQKIVNYLLYEKKINIHFLDVLFENGTASLYGVTNSKSVIDEAEKSAMEFDGVKNVNAYIQIVEEYNVIH